jgi:soluble lytic murein transglycosylase
VRRSYWLARLQEGVGKSANEAYHQIIDAGVPGYYDFLAHARLAEPMSYTSLRGHSYRTETLSMPAAVSDLLQQAEKCLDVHLRSDATVFLQSAAVRLKKAPRKESIPSLLYTAYLFQAAGQQLEAFKLYSVASELAQAYPHSTIFDFLTEMFPAPHAEFVSAVAKEWKVDADFLYAIMRQESAFNPGAVSSASARGLMQLMPFLGSQISRLWRYDAYYTNRSLFFAKENLAFAAYHLQQVQAILPHPALIAAAYNAGTKRVAQWWKRAPGLPLDIFIELIPVVETRNYVKLVLRNFLFYKLIRSGGALHPSTVPFRLPEPISLTAER